MTCHASLVQNAESTLPTGLASLMQELAVCQTHLTDALLVLAKGIEDQAQSINSLVESNLALVQAMAQEQGMDEGEPVYDMSGKPIRTS